MRSIYLAIPIVIFILFSTAMIFIKDTIWAVGMGIGIIALVSLLMVKDAIDWKYYLKHPPTLDIPILGLLETIPFYKKLDEAGKIKFQQRLALFMLAREYKVQPSRQNAEDEPTEAQEDLKAISSISAIILTWSEPDYLLKNIEQVVLYGHPFPSPRYKQLHTCESDKEDKVVIFSIPHLEKGVKDPYTYFDIGLYEWARVADKKSDLCYDWDQFYAMYGLGEDQLKLAIGMEKIDLAAACKVMKTHF